MTVEVRLDAMADLDVLETAAPPRGAGDRVAPTAGGTQAAQGGDA